MPRKKTASDRKSLPIGQAKGKVARARRNLVSGNDTGPITIRPKRPKKADETYPLRLTPQQRYSLTHSTRIRNKLRERLKQAGNGTQLVGFTVKELAYLDDEIGQAALFAFGADKKRLVSVLHQVTDLLGKLRAGGFEDVTPGTRKIAPKTGVPIYQFKITLLDIKPAVWRRIQVPDCTLADLHLYLQAAFGWWNYHLHQFGIDGERYGPPDPDGMDFGLEMMDENEMALSKLIPKSGRRSRWLYEYDFGDGWRHEIRFEGFAPANPEAQYPQCVAGERGCPPEDCGGPWGYAEYLAAIADPRHERHTELLEWQGPFDPEAFDAQEATKAMRKVT